MESRLQIDEERMEHLTTQLKDAHMLAEDADCKTEEVSTKMALVEDQLEATEDRAKFGYSKVQELDEELQVFLFYFCNCIVIKSAI